ncbi:MAG: hypothetical protein ABEJ65_00365, partial [bacterium]
QYNMKQVVLPLSNRSVREFFIPSSDWKIMAFDQGMIVFHNQSRQGCGGPISDCLLASGEEIQELPVDTSRKLRNIIEFMEQFRNQIPTDTLYKTIDYRKE